MRPFETAPSRCPARTDPASAEAARDRLRRLDLDHEVDHALHVDPQLERRRRDKARDPAGLQLLLDEHALLAREAAVVRPCNLFLGELVQPEREPLGEAAVVDEDDRRAVRLDEREQLGVHRRPDRSARLLTGAVGYLAVGLDRVVERRRRAELAQVVDGYDDLEVELLARACVDELDRAAAGDEAADLLERPLRRREANALRREPGSQPLEPLDRQRQMRPTLRPGDGVHFVQDQGLDTAQRPRAQRR